MLILEENKPETVGIDSARLARAYNLLEKWTAAGEVPSGALCVGRGDQMVAPRFFGRMGPEADAEPIRDDAMFLMASITKPIVYLGAMLLVERGLLTLTDRVTRFFPDYAAHHKEETLILHLFTHTSGLPDMLENNVELRKAHAPLSEYVEHGIRDTMPLFPPGTKLSYQSVGTNLVAELIRVIDGRPVAQFLREEIFAPLGLKSIGLGSQGFDVKRIVRSQVPEYQDPSFGWNSTYWRELGSPWGGIFSSPADFAVLCSLMLNGVFGFDGTLAAQLAIVLSAAVSYMGHAWFTFSVEAANVQRIVRFVLSFVLTSLISWTVTVFLIPVLSLKYWQGLFIVAVVVPAFNYAFLRFSVFRLS